MSPETRFRVAAQHYLDTDGLYADFSKRPIRYFGAKTLRGVTDRDLRRYRRLRRQMGGSEGRIARELYFVKRVCALAKIELMPVTDPLTRKPEVSVPAVDLRKILQAASIRSEYILTAAQAALVACTGVWRYNELRQIRWADIDPFREVIRFQGKEFPFTPELREALIAAELLREGGQSDDRVFWRKKDTHPWFELMAAAGYPSLTRRALAERAGRAAPLRSHRTTRRAA